MSRREVPRYSYIINHYNNSLVLDSIVPRISVLPTLTKLEMSSCSDKMSDTSGDKTSVLQDIPDISSEDIMKQANKMDLLGSGANGTVYRTLYNGEVSALKEGSSSK